MGSALAFAGMRRTLLGTALTLAIGGFASLAVSNNETLTPRPRYVSPTFGTTGPFDSLPGATSTSAAERARRTHNTWLNGDYLETARGLPPGTTTTTPQDPDTQVDAFRRRARRFPSGKARAAARTLPSPRLRPTTARPLKAMAPSSSILARRRSHQAHRRTVTSPHKGERPPEGQPLSLHEYVCVRLRRANVGGLQSFIALLDVELDSLTLGQAAVAVHLDRAEVHEDVRRAVGLRDEPVALLAVEPFDGAGGHGHSPLLR
jgi:hypothetical protein